MTERPNPDRYSTQLQRRLLVALGIVLVAAGLALHLSGILPPG